MKFSDPYTLNFLWALLPVLGIIGYGMNRRNKIIRAFMAVQMLSHMAPGYTTVKRWIKAVLILVAAGFAVISLAGPLAGFKWEKVEQKGVDIMIALDCSRSMLAGDIKPDRLARAKREIIDLLRMMHSDRAGLVAFSGTAILQCPLTLDREAFHIFLDVLEPGYLPVGGTDIAGALETCAQGFEKDTDSQKAIVLITDGEDTAGDGIEKAKELAEKGIKIFCVAVGNLDGAPIPDENGGFKKDRSGNIILSKMDEKGLQKIAALTGGAYVRSVAGDMDLDVIYKDHILSKMEKSELTSGKKKVWENRFQWFLFPCVILLFIEFLLSPAGRNKTNLLSVVFAVFIAWQVIMPVDAQAKMVSSSVKEGIAAFEAGQYEQAQKHFIDAQLEQPDNFAHYYNIGAAAYMNSEFDQARKNFLEAARSDEPDLRHNALYNLANTEYKMGNLDAAVQGYEKVLESFPDDKHAAENLEFVKKKREEQKQQQQQQNPQDQKSDGQDENKEENKQKQSGQDDPSQSPQGRDETGENNGNQKPENHPQSGQDGQNGQNGQNDENRSKESPAQPESFGQQESPGAKENQTDDSKNPVAGDTGQADPAKGSESPGMDQMLNRLEDKPGRAMMPAVRERNTDKDW